MPTEVWFSAALKLEGLITGESLTHVTSTETVAVEPPFRA